jgi:hypothetical protein
VFIVSIYRLKLFIAVSLMVILVTGTWADDATMVDRFLEDIAGKAEAAQKESKTAVVGKDGWLFLTAELRALSVGPFWGEYAGKVSRASRPQYADPLEPIVDFSKQLADAGIEHIIVPVPAKASVYPEKISNTIVADENGEIPYLAPYHREFYEILRDRGVNVLDITHELVNHRDDAEGLTFCKTDAHWSGRACDLAARLIVDQIRNRDWVREIPRNQYSTELREVEIVGDMLRMVDESNHIRETLPLTFVGVKEKGLVPVDTDRDSPVLLMGDSHTLVFHDPSIHAKGAGLADHLALQLGFPVDLIGVRGSGATATRAALLRRKDNLRGKKLVIWCISMREFTESFSGWKNVPVIRTSSE